jgi:serine/threonine protein kinase
MSGERIPDVTAFESPPRRAINYSSISREQPLGRGGQAVVYRVDISDGPPDTIAYKEPLQSGTLSSEAIEAFLSEADSWELVDQRERNRSRWTKSEHIVGILNTGDQLPWIAMEYMDGGGLDELLEANSDGINVDRALWIAECLAEGLKIAHANGIAHLDLKPDNVLFRSTGTGTWNVPKIADWGLARLLARETGTMEALSPQYAAPEQFEPDVYGEPDTLTDIYQLGAVLCAMLTGEPPYTGSRLSVMRSIVDGDGPPNLSERQNRIPVTVESAVSQALAAEKNERYANISQFQQELKALRIEDQTKSTLENSSSTNSRPRSDQGINKDSQQNNQKSNNSTSDVDSELAVLSRINDEEVRHLKQAGIYSIHDLAIEDDFELAEKINRSPNEVNRWIEEAKLYNKNVADWDAKFGSLPGKKLQSSTRLSASDSPNTSASSTANEQSIRHQRLNRVDQDEANALATIGIQSLYDLADVDEIEIARQLDRSPNEIARWREEAQEVTKGK